MKVLIKGAGDLATGIAFILYEAGHRILMTEIAVPLTVRRTVAMSRAVYEGRAEVEGMTGVLAHNIDEALQIQSDGNVAVMVDETAGIKDTYKPDVIVDAILAKKNIGTSINDGPFVIAAGPGFTAGKDCCCVIETKRGDSLGRIIWGGSALPNTGIPGEIAGYSADRLIKSPCEGKFTPRAAIGTIVKKGEIAAWVDDTPVYARMDGIVRGMLTDGVYVSEGLKLGDIDSRKDRTLCYTISDKARCIGEGVLRAIKMRHASQAVVVLAAGAGRRFGGNKLMADLEGKPLYMHMLELLEGFSDVMKVIVTSQEHIQADALKGEFLVVENKEPQFGISRSVKLGLEACMARFPNLQSVMFMVCDQPRLTKESVRRILKAAEHCPGAIVCAASGGENRNPAVWDKKYWMELLSITGDRGGKQIMERHREEVVQIEVEPEEVKDIDRKADLMEKEDVGQ